MSLKLSSVKDSKIIKLLRENPHVFLLVYWLVYLVFFVIEENLIVENYTPIHIPLDDKIPFCIWFAIPYLIWYPYIVVPLLWLLFKNPPEFKRLMWFIMLTYSLTLVIYALFPNGQDMRDHSVLTGDGILYQWMRFFWSYDTNTNVCPSIHVIGTLAATFALIHTKIAKKWWGALSIAILTLSICFSIVFVKQHSIVDLFAGVALSAVAYPLIYNKKTRKIAESKAILPFRVKEEKKEKSYV
jgi:membrane-associated phospholipid phosphatase